MRFLSEAVAYAHFTLPPDAFRLEADALSKRLGALTRSHPDSYRGHRITYLTGQSDLLLQLRLRDLRLAFDFDYQSRTTGSNWLFAIPFSHHRRNGVKRTDLALTYAIHLRVSRALYRSGGADVESEIVTAIAAAARGKLSIEVLAGFGWSDLIVTGTFAAIDDFVLFVAAIQNLRLTRMPTHPAFRRTLTLIGYDYKIRLDSSSS